MKGSRGMGPVRCKGNYAASVMINMPVGFRERTRENGNIGILAEQL